MGTMKKWVRWEGILAFVVIAAVLSFFWIALVDGYVRRSIERTVAFLVGAEVNVDNADLTLSPLGFIITRIQVTSPENPALNAVEIQRVEFTLDTAHLLMRKTIIESMGIEGVALGTTRARPGRVYRERSEEVSPASEKRLLWFAVPDIDREDIRRVLESASLETLKSIQALNRDIESRNSFWTSRIEELPDEERMREYQSRIDTLQEARERDLKAFLLQGAQIRDLYSDIRSDLGLLTDSYEQFREDYRTINTQLSRLAVQPAQDARRIAQKYGPTPENIGSISGMLFGERLGTWVERSLRWHGRISPMLERRALTQEEQRELRPPRSEGIDVRFREYAPMPDFLIRRAAASIITRGSTLQGTLQNITPDQDILGQPLTFLFSGNNLASLENIRLDGALDHIDPLQPRDTVSLALKGYRIPSMELGPEALPVSLREGILDTGLTAVLSGSSLSADLSGAARAVSFLVRRGDEASGFSTAFADAFSRITGFSFDARVSGTPQDYGVSISSSLDQVFQGMLDSLAKDLSAQFEAQARARLEQGVREPLDSLKTRAGSLDRINEELSARIAFAESLLKDSIF
jgi:uncharacterized protein (TIGR03545 family)